MGAMIEIRLERDSMCSPCIHPDLKLFFVLEGTVSLGCEDQVFALSREDVIVVGSGKRHSWRMSDGALLGCLFLSEQKLEQLLHQDTVVFWCNSALGEAEVYSQLRHLLKKLFWEYAKGTGRDEIYLRRLFYEVLQELTQEFLLNAGALKGTACAQEKERDMERKGLIVRYIRQHYREPLSLQDLADELGLSAAYLSKYIKRRFGMGFLQYVTQVRLQYACGLLLHSEQSMMQVALETGFGSLSSFNRVFKEAYGVTPSAWRKEQPKQDGAETTLWEQSHVKENTLWEQSHVKEKIAPRQGNLSGSAGSFASQISVVVPAGEETMLSANWNQMINIGTAKELLDSEMQEHVLYLKELLHFRYVRFWDLYSPQMFLDYHTPGKKYNFGRLDRVLDFLLLHDLIPYIELGEKTKKLLKNRGELLIGEKGDFFTEEGAWAYFIDCLAHHLVRRYGAKEVQKWRFELWMKEYYPNEEISSDQAAPYGRAPDRAAAAMDEGAHGSRTTAKAHDGRKTAEAHDERKNAESQDFLQKMAESYLQRFDQAAEILRRHIPGVQIGGSGVSFQYGREFFAQYLSMWAAHDQRPDFLSVYLYPYATEAERGRRRNQSADRDFLKNRLHEIKAIIGRSPLKGIRLHVTEWNFTVSSRNVLNDSCNKGAFVLKTIIDAAGEAELLAYWFGSDLFADYYDSSSPLNGSGGLLTRDGIAKPACYAFDFANRLGSRLCHKGEHAMVTREGEQWRIVCHNYKHFQDQYRFVEENEIEIETQNQFLSDQRILRLNFVLPAAGKMEYRLKIYAVNRDWGSVQDEWLRMEMPTEMTPEDLRYLNRVSTPRMVIKRVRAEGSLTFTTSLQPGELQFIQVIPLAVPALPAQTVQPHAAPS